MPGAFGLVAQSVQPQGDARGRLYPAAQRRWELAGVRPFLGRRIRRRLGRAISVDGPLRSCRADRKARRPRGRDEIGRAHVRTPVTNAQLVCRLLLEKKKKDTTE